jgi:hypothetical protein
MKTFLGFIVFSMAILLGACRNGNEGPPPVKVDLETQATVVRTVQVSLSAEVSTSKQGLISRMPAGIKASYRVVGSKSDTRVDLPGTMFLDGKARVVFYNSALNRTSILLSSNMQADPYLSSINLSQLNVNAGLINSLNVTEQPFMTMTSSRFTTLATNMGAIVASASSADMPTQTMTSPTAAAPLMATRSLVSSGVTITQRMYFDVAVGAITRVDTTLNGQTQVETSTSTLLYTAVPGITGGIVPYDISTSYEASLKSLQPNMQLPTSSRTLTTDAPVLAPGQVVTQSFATTGGQGNVDVNKQITTQRVKYTSIAVNTLADSYFQIGQ